MGIMQITTSTTGQVNVNPRRVKIITTDSLATVTASGYLNPVSLEGFTIAPTDVIDMYYNYVSASSPGLYAELTPVISSSGTITLQQFVGAITYVEVACAASALASAGKVVIKTSYGVQQYKVRDIKVRYSASGLSGGGGDRLLAITDGTTVYNNAGITAALLGTPVNTVWGGSGNPLPGSVDMDTSTAAGANLYAQYTGGTTDFSTGTVNLLVKLERVA